MPEINPFKSPWFEKSIQIHQECKAQGFSLSQAKLFVYVYIKSSGEGLKEFLESRKNAEALRVMLGLEHYFKFDSAEEKESIENISNVFKRADQEICQDTGKEFVIGSELYDRLRFHEDMDFQGKVLMDYFTAILPQIQPELRKLLAA